MVCGIISRRRNNAGIVSQVMLIFYAARFSYDFERLLVHPVHGKITGNTIDARRNLPHKLLYCNGGCK